MISVHCFTLHVYSFWNQEGAWVSPWPEKCALFLSGRQSDTLLLCVCALYRCRNYQRMCFLKFVSTLILFFSQKYFNPSWILRQITTSYCLKSSCFFRCWCLDQILDLQSMEVVWPKSPLQKNWALHHTAAQWTRWRATRPLTSCLEQSCKNIRGQRRRALMEYFFCSDPECEEAEMVGNPASDCLWLEWLSLLAQWWL